MKTLALICCMIVLSAVASAQSLPQMIAQEKAYSVNDLIQQLRSQDANIRAFAADTLARMGAEAKEAVPALAAALKDRDQFVRLYAARALRRMGAEAKEAAAALIAALKDQDSSVRASAADALGRMGAEAKEAVTALIAALKDQDSSVRASAADALGRMGAEAKEAVTALIAALNDRDGDVRRSAARALRPMWAESKEAVPALTAALKDQDSSVRASAAESLRYMASALFDSGSTEILPELKVAYKALKDHTDPEVKSNADDVQRTIDYLEFLWWGKVGQHAVKLINEHHYVCIGTATFLLLQITWLLIFWRRPYWLLRISESIHKANQTLTIQISNFPISLKLPYSTLIFLYQSRPRVLNAWVQKYLGIVQRKFEEKRTSKDRQIHIAIPAVI